MPKALNEVYTDKEYITVDSTIMRVHQDGSNPKGRQMRHAMGRSRGGLSSKIHMACDALGYPLSCIITGGDRHDATQGKALLRRHLKAQGYVWSDSIHLTLAAVSLKTRPVSGEYYHSTHDANGRPHKLEKFTILYADNGRGKFTLAIIFRSLSERECRPYHPGRADQVQLESIGCCSQGDPSKDQD